MTDSVQAAPAKPHYLGHRERLRNRFMTGGADALPDYELMELVLFRALPRRDTKPIAKELIDKFGSFANAISAEPARLHEVRGLGHAAVTELKLIYAAATRLTRDKVTNRDSLASWTELLDYCRAVMARETIEQFRILFLDHKNKLIADEVQQRGTVNHTPVYPREVIKRALELSASAIILVHNHPSGDPTPSRADIEMTKRIVDIADQLSITVHDHIIVGHETHTSLRGLKLI